MRTIRASTLVASTAILACSDADHPTTPTSAASIIASSASSATMGSAEVAIGISATGPFAQEQARLLVTVQRIDVHVADEDGDGDGWVTVFTGPVEVDLADASTSETLLGGADVPAGRITQVRLILDGDATLVLDGIRARVACPSCTVTGIKILTFSIEVAEGESLHLDIVFDTLASVALSLEGLRLTPLVRVEVVRR